ncbi:MAG: VWA domain-containing protein [Myxococcota bacterium]|nr:VWA domain-containing protein [Myxococcota bacterium]
MDRVQRFRLILGKTAEPELRALSPGAGALLGGEALEIDEALGHIYDAADEGGESGQRSAGLGRSAPRLAKWLGDIRGYFPSDVVAVIQQDAIEKKGLTQLLFEPETLGQVTPSIELVGTLMSLKGMIPDKTKDTARMVVRAVVEELIRKLQSDIVSSVRGALDRSRHSPLKSFPNIDWKRTIGSNLKNYIAEKKTIIPDRFFFWSRQMRRKEWNVIVCMDQSGSMAESVVYGAVTGAILASMPSLETHVVVFDTEVVDLTEQCSDPVDLLFGVQLGGGTDINRAVKYCQGLVHDPRKTLFLLITDLFEGGNQAELVRRMEDMAESGVRAVTLLALSDSGVPIYDENLAKRLRALGIPCFGCTPQLLPELLSGAIRGADLEQLAARLVKT